MAQSINPGIASFTLSQMWLLQCTQLSAGGWCGVGTKRVKRWCRGLAEREVSGARGWWIKWAEQDDGGLGRRPRRRDWWQHTPDPDTLPRLELLSWINVDLGLQLSCLRSSLTHSGCWSISQGKGTNVPLPQQTYSIQNTTIGCRSTHASTAASQRGSTVVSWFTRTLDCKCFAWPAKIS